MIEDLDVLLSLTKQDDYFTLSNQLIEAELVYCASDVSAHGQVLFVAPSDRVAIRKFCVKSDLCPRQCQDVILRIILEIANLDHAIVLGVSGVVLEGEELVAAFSTVL